MIYIYTVCACVLLTYKIIQNFYQTTPGSFDDCSLWDAFVSAILCYFGQVWHRRVVDPLACRAVNNQPQSKSTGSSSWMMATNINAILIIMITIIIIMIIIIIIKDNNMNNSKHSHPINTISSTCSSSTTILPPCIRGTFLVVHHLDVAQWLPSNTSPKR